MISTYTYALQMIIQELNEKLAPSSVLNGSLCEALGMGGKRGEVTVAAVLLLQLQVL